MEQEPQKRIIHEPMSQLRAVARSAMKGHMRTLVGAAVLYSLCIGLPVIVIEQITGLWDTLERATLAYVEILENSALFSLPADASADAVTDAARAWGAQYQTWAEEYGDKTGFSFATWLYMLFVPGALTLGLSNIWLRVLRGQEIFSDMVFSGFENFFRAMVLNFIRNVFMAIWAILLLFPGVIAYYRYSLAFFLLADDPKMQPAAALALSKYYMWGNKGSRFVLDLTFLVWFVISAVVFALVSMGALALVGAESSVFVRALVWNICGAVIFAPLSAYRGVTAAEYYHRVICRDPRGFKELPAPRA